MVVVLSDLEDLSYGEIAEVMEIPRWNRQESALPWTPTATASAL